MVSVDGSNGTVRTPIIGTLPFKVNVSHELQDTAYVQTVREESGLLVQWQTDESRDTKKNKSFVFLGSVTGLNEDPECDASV